MDILSRKSYDVIYQGYDMDIGASEAPDRRGQRSRSPYLNTGTGISKDLLHILHIGAAGHSLHKLHILHIFAS